MVSAQAILLGAFAFAQAVLGVDRCNFRNGDVIALKGDTGKYLTRCLNCVGGSTHPDSVNFQGQPSNGTPAYSYWTVVTLGNGKLALRGDTGNYLARCENCVSGAKYPNTAFVHVPDWSGPWAQWTCENTLAGKIAFKADNGLYLARCNNCADNSPPDVAFVYAETWKNTPYAQFDAEFYKRGSNCNFNDGDVIGLLADTGKYITRCSNCIPRGTFIDSVSLQLPMANLPAYQYWTVYNADNGKLAFKGDLGNYLARCYNCAPGSTYPNMIFDHVADWRANPLAQFSCEDAADGKIALKADTGRYVTRCWKCVPGGPDELVSMHVNDWREGAWAQFTVVRKPLVLTMALNEEVNTVRPSSRGTFIVLGSMLAGCCLTLVAVYGYNYRKHEAKGFQRV
ncbi:hypothetical protein AC1031_007447 [Aphanomyces cochlioides]|nr:hypothetical protein AC1031_007447 [Aphanomyces cochlioides]